MERRGGVKRGEEGRGGQGSGEEIESCSHKTAGIMDIAHSQERWMVKSSSDRARELSVIGTDASGSVVQVRVVLLSPAPFDPVSPVRKEP